MSSLASYNPEDEPSKPSPARTATISVDDLGITINADLRITGVVSEVRELFARTAPEELASLLEKVVVIGATNVATAAEITAADTSRMRLERSVERLEAAHERLLERHEEQSKQLGKQIETALQALRTQLGDSTKQEAELREQIKNGQSEVVKAAQKLEVSRGDMEKRATEAISKLVEAQTKAKDEVVKGTEAAFKKLMDKNDPTSAPSVIGEVMGKAAAEMRATTAKNVGDLVKELTKQFGESSPLVERIAKTVREGAEAEIKRVEEQVDKLRTELLEQRTRAEHSPNVIGDSYEDDLLELLGHGAAVHGWTVDRTGTAIGNSAGSKKGDHIVTDETDRKVAAIEARARKNVSARAFYEGLSATAENRGVKIVVYCARSVGDLPSGLGEFSRGLVPFHYKRLADGVHALATVIDPVSDAVVERLAMVLWLVHRLHSQLPDRGSQSDAVARIAQALPWVQQITTRLSSFRAIKAGLTKADGEIGRVVASIATLEAKLSEDLDNLEQVLWGDPGSGAAPAVA